MRTTSVLLVGAALAMGTGLTEADGPRAARESLVLSEVSPLAASEGHPWIELWNPTASSVPLAGFSFQAGTLARWTFPAGSPPLDPGGYVLVVLDGPGGGSRSSPHVLALHAPASLADAWTPSQGELALYSPVPGRPGGEVPVDYVAWGAPGKAWSLKIRTTPWGPATYVPLAEGFGVYDPGTTIVPGASIGLYPGSTTSAPADWALFDSDEVTPGAPNHVPRPKAFTLADGAVVASHSVGIGWARRKGDESYHFELAADEAFSTSVINEEDLDVSVLRVGSELPEGTYYFRVTARAGSFPTSSSRIRQFEVMDTSCDLMLPPQAERLTVRDWMPPPRCDSPPSCRVVPSLQFKFQRKDTNLVCLEGCPTDPACGCCWDRPHRRCVNVVFPGARRLRLCSDRVFSRLCGRADSALGISDGDCEHGAHYCGMASVSMVVSAYGGCLSQDRIAFKEGENAGGSLWHNTNIVCVGPTTAATGGDCTALLTWAFRNSPPEYHYAPSALGTVMFAGQVRQWIDEGRPIMCELPGHFVVLAGYCVDGRGRQWAIIYDPESGPTVKKFLPWSCAVKAIWVPPKRIREVAVLSDELSVWRDPDSDGLVDFDEVNRFCLDPACEDTDCDGVGDKEETLAAACPTPSPAPCPCPTPSP